MLGQATRSQIFGICLAGALEARCIYVCPTSTVKAFTEHLLLLLQSFYSSSGFCPGLPGWAGTRNAKPGR